MAYIAKPAHKCGRVWSPGLLFPFGYFFLVYFFKLTMFASIATASSGFLKEVHSHYSNGDSEE